MITLTFDDGLDQVYTPQIAALLRQYQAKSTFFIVGSRVSQYPEIVNKVLSNARNGDIVLFHDYGGNQKQTVQALEQILPELKKRGCQFVTVTELLRGYGRAKQVVYP